MTGASRSRMARGANHETGLWARAGTEAVTTAFLADPIVMLLMRAERLTARELAAVIEEAKRRPRKYRVGCVQ